MQREDILERLALVLGNARDGQGSLVFVSGEAGAGKSRVVQTALAGVEARWGWCEPLSVPRPLGPFRDITTLGTTAPDVGDVLLARMRSEPPRRRTPASARHASAAEPRHPVDPPGPRSTAATHPAD